MRLDGRLESEPCPPGGKPGKPRTAQVIVVLGLLTAAEGLAVDEVPRIQLATAQEQVDAVVVVLAARDNLVGVLELSGRDAPVLRTGGRQCGTGIVHESSERASDSTGTARTRVKAP